MYLYSDKNLLEFKKKEIYKFKIFKNFQGNRINLNLLTQDH